MYARNIRILTWQCIRVYQSVFHTLMIEFVILRRSSVYIILILCRIRAVHTKRNHYDTLKLKSNCTARCFYKIVQTSLSCVSKLSEKLIKFLDQNHPDVNQGGNTKQNTENFRNIVDAYKVLGKPESRAIYDAVINQESINVTYSRPSDRNHSTSGAYRPSYQNRSRSGAFYTPPYRNQSASGSKKVSNKTIVIYCIIFMFSGLIVQSILIRFSVTFSRDKMNRISMEAGKSYAEAKARGEKYRIDYQLTELAYKNTTRNND